MLCKYIKLYGVILCCALNTVGCLKADHSDYNEFFDFYEINRNQAWQQQLNERLRHREKMENPFEDKFEKMMENIHEEQNLF